MKPISAAAQNWPFLVSIAYILFEMFLAILTVGSGRCIQVVLQELFKERVIYLKEIR